MDGLIIQQLTPIPPPCCIVRVDLCDFIGVLLPEHCGGHGASYLSPFWCLGFPCDPVWLAQDGQDDAQDDQDEVQDGQDEAQDGQDEAQDGQNEAQDGQDEALDGPSGSHLQLLES